MIKNIIFDFGGVLVGLDRHRCTDAFARLGAGAIAGYVDECRQEDLFHELEVGAIGIAEFCGAPLNYLLVRYKQKTFCGKLLGPLMILGLFLNVFINPTTPAGVTQTIIVLSMILYNFGFSGPGFVGENIQPDVTDVDDTPGSEQCGTVQLGKGAAIKVMDRSVICHPKLVYLLEQAAQEHQIPVQKDILKAGGTDAGAIHTTKLGVVTGGVSVPCRYIHTPTEMVHQKDVQNCVDLLLAVLRKNLNEV